MKKALIYLMVLLLFPLCPVAQAQEKDITLMIYMTGSDLEEQYFAASRDIAEMAASQYDSTRVNLLIMTGGCRQWWTPGITSTNPGIYRLEENCLVQEMILPMASMAQPALLSVLLQYGYTHYPARQFGLVFWNHGGGPVNGVCSDTLFQNDTLMNDELETALKNSPFHPGNRLSFVGFDACLMASAEMACLLAPYAEYMIASQETEPGSGWDYGFLRDVHLARNGAEVGQRIIDRYYFSTMLQNPRNHITLSLTDLSKMAAVQQASDALFARVTENMTAQKFSMISVQRKNTKSIGRAADNNNDYDLVDLTGLAQHYTEFAPQEAQLLEVALAEAVVHNRSNVEGLQGLSVYHPYYNKLAYLMAWKEIYQQYPLSPAYLSYLDAYAAIWLGARLTAWSGLQPKVALLENGTQEISLQLTPEQVANFAAAQCLVVQPDENWGYSFVYRETMPQPDENGVLRLAYNGRQLCMLDENGVYQNSGYTYYVIGDQYVLLGALRYDQTEDDFKTVTLHYRLLKDGKTLEFMYAKERQEDGTFTTRHDLDFSHWRYFECLVSSAKPVYDTQGDLFPFEQWEDDGSVRYQVIDMAKEYNLAFSDEQVNSAALAACIYLYDTQGNCHVTHMRPLINPNARSVDVGNLCIEENGQFSVTLTKVEMVASELFPKLNLYMEVENKTEHSLKLNVTNILLNNVLFRENISHDLPYTGIKPHEHQQMIVSLPAQDLRMIGLSRLDSVQLRLVKRAEDILAEDERFFTPPVNVDVSLDYLMEGSSPVQPLVYGRQEDIGLELLEVQAADVDHLKAVVRVYNYSNQEADIWVGGNTVNEVQLSETVSMDTILLPAESSVLTTVSITNNIYSMYIDGAFFPQGILASLGVHEAESFLLQCWVKDGDYQKKLIFDFVLPKPISLIDGMEEALLPPFERILLFENEQLTLHLMGLYLNDREVIALMTCENKLDAEIYVEWQLDSLNGIMVEDVMWQDNWQIKVPGCTLLMYKVEGNLEENAGIKPEEVKNLALSGRLQLPGNPSRLNAKVELDVLQFSSDGRILADQLQVNRADVQEPVPQAVLSVEVLPPPSGEHAVLLQSPHLPGTESVYAWVVILGKGERVVPLTGGFLLEKKDNMWSCEFSGLYAGMKSSPEEIWTVANITTAEDKERWKMNSLTIHGKEFRSDPLLVSDIDISLGRDGQSAQLLLQVPATVDYPEDFDKVISGEKVYSLSRDAQGRLLHVQDMPVVEQMFFMSSFENLTPPFSFQLLPFSDYPGEVYVMYSYRMEDGSSFSTEPELWQAHFRP